MQDNNVLRDERVHKDDFIAVAALFLIALFVRIIQLMWDPLLLRDSASYLLIAGKWIETNNYTEALNGLTIFPPLPLYLTKESIKLGFGPEVGGRSITLFCGSLIPGLMYLFSKELSPKKSIAYLCAIIMVFHPNLAMYSTQPIRESMYMLLCGIMMIAIVRYMKQMKKWHLIICGMACALGILCRYESLEFMVLCHCLIIGICLYKKKQIKRLATDLMLFQLSAITTFFLAVATTGSNYDFLMKIKEYF